MCDLFTHRAPELVQNTRAFQDRIGIVGFRGEEKSENAEKNLSEQSREPTTNSTHI